MKNFICCSLTAIFLVLDMLAGNISLFPAFSVYTAVIFFLAYGWKYGVNKSTKVNGKEKIKQYACDFYGNKEVIKTI